ncbi:MAG: hypothetical protein AAF363_22510, partial [Bacteroidota bacterium]
KDVIKPLNKILSAPPREMKMDITFNEVINGNEIKIGIYNCNIYTYSIDHKKKWKKIFHVNKSLFFKGCTYKEILHIDDYIVVYLCNTPFGAGGGCGAGEAFYRTKDGVDWEDGTKLQTEYVLQDNDTYWKDLKSFKGTVFDQKWRKIEPLE